MLFMNFTLRSGSEHCDLCHDPPQLQLEEQAGKRACLWYCEDVSKNHECPPTYTLRPLQKPNPAGSTQLISHSKLDDTVARMCKAAGINHSLCATAATWLYQAGLDAQRIMEITGYQNLDGVRNYKQTSVEQQQVVSDILSFIKKLSNECSVSQQVHYSKKTTVE